MGIMPQHSIPTGSCLTLDGVRWNVIGKDESKIFVEGADCGEVTNFSLEWVRRKLADFTARLVTPSDHQRHQELLAYTNGIACVEQLSKQERLNVRARLSLVLAIGRLYDEGYKQSQRFLDNENIREKVIGYAYGFANDKDIFKKARIGKPQTPYEVPRGRTLKEWYDRYHYFGGKDIALVGRDYLKGPFKKNAAPEVQRRRLSPMQERFAAYVVDRWLNVKKPHLRGLYELSKAKFDVTPEDRAAGFKFPSITTVSNRKKAKVSKRVEVIGREGERNAVNSVGTGATDAPGLFFGEACETDQVVLSLFVKDKNKICVRKLTDKQAAEELGPDELRRPILNFIKDLSTRYPLGWVLSETADSDATLEMVRMAMRDKSKEKIRYGCNGDPAPAVRIRTLTSDNGTAVRNSRMAEKLAGMGIVYQMARAHHSNDKPFVESDFRTLEFQVIELEDGYVGGRPGALPGYAPKADTKLIMKELYAKLTRYFIDEFPYQSHLGIGMYGASPVQKLREVNDRFKQIDAPDPYLRIIHLGEKFEATTHKQGVSPHGLHFNSTELQMATGGARKKVTVHIDPDYLAKALVTIEGGDGGLIEVDLKMSSVKDLNFWEFLSVKKQAAEMYPELIEHDNDILMKARKRRAEETGMFPDPNDLASYQRLPALQQKAERLATVERPPTTTMDGTVPPGRLMDRSHPSARKNKAVDVSSVSSGPNAEPPKTFTKITRSKL